MYGTVSRGGSVTVAAYGKKTPKTIARDVNRLIEMDLVRTERKGIVANKEIILGFLPPQKKKEEA